jgi:micrococcal nuclease
VLFFFCGNLSANTRRKIDSSSPGDTGQVIVVYDGDTIKIRFDDGSVRKARLIGIDAPEIGDDREEVKFLAYTAKRFTFFHLYRKRIRVEYDWERTDKYGRILVYVWTKEEGLFNEFILGEGYAFVFTKFPFKKEYRRRFIAAERQARELEKGLWKKEPFLTIEVENVLGHVGELLSVIYVCVDVRSHGNFVYLNSSGDFSAVIPHTQISLFPEASGFKGRTVSVNGFLETYKGKPQIMVFLPQQLEKMEGPFPEGSAWNADSSSVSSGS